MLNGGTVSQKGSKQETIVDFTIEVEYIAASDVAKKVVWIKKFVTELGVVPSIVDPVLLYCNNNGAIAQANELRSHQRSKHVLRRYHVIREIIVRDDIKIEQVSTENNVVDPLTKALLQQKHDGHVESLGIRYMDDWLQQKWEIVSVCLRSIQIGCYVTIQIMNTDRINWFLYLNIFLYVCLIYLHV